MSATCMAVGACMAPEDLCGSRLESLVRLLMGREGDVNLNFSNHEQGGSSVG
jgi:hypothetical protein